MAYWRKQGVMAHHGSSSFNRKPPLPLDITMRHSTLPLWEKKFFHSICSIPWKKFLENQKYMHINRKVMNWEDSAVKDAFESAKMRFWGKLNDLPCSLPLPDPDIYIDKVDWDASVDPKLYQDLERDDFPSEEETGDKVVIFGTSFLLNQGYSGAGWGDNDEEFTKSAEAAQGWESNLQESIETNSWEQHYVPFEHEKEEYYEWQNGQNDDQGWNRTEGYYSWQTGQQNDHHGWNEREKYGGSDSGGRNDWNGNWGAAWDGNNRGREKMRWGRKSGGYYGNEYQMNQMNRGRRNNRGRGRGRRGNFGCVPAAAW